MNVWEDYSREEREESAKVTGRLRCVITDVEETESKTSGLPMIVITVRPSGTVFKVKSYLVHNDKFNRNATQFFDAFPEIGDGNRNYIEWIGCEGAANFVEDDNGYLEVKSLVFPREAESLPPFEGDKPQRVTVTKIDDPEDSDEEMPWV